MDLYYFHVPGNKVLSYKKVKLGWFYWPTRNRNKAVPCGNYAHGFELKFSHPILKHVQYPLYSIIRCIPCTTLDIVHWKFMPNVLSYIFLYVSPQATKLPRKQPSFSVSTWRKVTVVTLPVESHGSPRVAARRCGWVAEIRKEVVVPEIV